MSRTLSNLTLALCAALLGCSRAPSVPARCVVLISCDTLRPDHLGAYGYGRGTSPNLDAFAREAVVFDAAYSAAPWTRPALSSLMTGRYPEEVGAAPGNLRMMPAQVETLAERLSANGVQTAAVVSNGLIKRQRGAPNNIDLAQGFELYNDHMESIEANRNMPERLAPQTTGAALAWLERHEEDGGGPFFLWVHYQDPHGPYTPPAAEAERFERPPSDAPRRVPVGSSLSGKGQIPLYQVLPRRTKTGELVPEQRAEVYLDRYDAEIAFFDEHLGRLLDGMRAYEWWDEALVIFTSDHGESLGERDHWFCHGESAARELLHVPLIVRYHKGGHSPRAQRRDGFARSDRPVSHLDVWPTVLSALELPAEGSRGLSLVTRELPRERVLAGSYLAPAKEEREWAVTDGRWRLVWGFEGTARLYDLADDPGETRDVSREHADIARGLRQRFEAERLRHPGETVEGQNIEMDPETAEALRRLGYFASEEEDDLTAPAPVEGGR